MVNLRLITNTTLRIRDLFLDNPDGKRSDVFSLGLVLYEMIAGRHPYAGKGDEEIIEELKSEEEIPNR